MKKIIIKCNPKYEGMREEVIKMLAGERPAGAREIYAGRNTLYRADVGGIPIVVKEFRKPNAVNAYVYTTLRSSKAARSFENGMKMLSLGFLTPEPVAYGEIREGIKLKGSIYVSRELTGAREMRHWEELPEADTLLPAFAAEIVRLHRAGVWHKDFSPGNILFTGDPAKGYEFHYVDLNRMKFGEHSRKHLMSMLRSINLNPAETARIGRLYGEAAGEDPAKTEREALRQLDGYLNERRRKARWKKLFGHK